jgi:hypothetical protein
MPNGQIAPPTIVLRDPIARDDIGVLCGRVAPVLERRDGPLICDVREVRRPDAVTIDALARLELTARRLGRRIRLVGAHAELVDLLAFVGLVVEVAGQPEQREQALRVQEEADPRDPVT